MIENILFIAFAAMLLGSALMVITVQNPVKSALFLVLCFFAATGLWLLLTAEFLALVLILVYVGAVMTLFLFVVMTLNVDPATLRQPYLKYYIPVSLILTALITAVLIYALRQSQSPFIIFAQNSVVAPESNTAELGNVLYTQYALPFEITGVILLVAMIAAISLTLVRPAAPKHQNIDAQVKVNPKDRVRLVK